MLKTAQTRLLPQYIGIGEPSLIRPLCAPIMPDDSFGTDVAGRYSERVYSLWKRLSLVYAEEGVQAAAPEKLPVIVNSFTSRVLVQLFAGNQFNRLVKYDQPNSVFSTKFSAAAKTEKKRAAAELVRYISERTELSAALEDFGRTLSGTASERGAFVALAALSRISAGKLTDGGRRAVEALSAAISETDGAAAQTAAELSRAADERTAQELGEKLTELTRRYSAAAEKNRALSAAVEYAKELIESGSAEKAAPEAISRAALERFDKRCGVQGAAAERLRALSERTEQGGLPAQAGEARVISAQRQARAGLMGAEAETAALAAGVLAGRAAAYPAYSAGALLPVTASIGSADVPTARTRAGEPLVYAQDSVQAEGAQAFGADIAASVARRVVKAAGLMSAGSPNSAVGRSAAGSGAASAVGAANAGVGGSAAAVGAMAAQRAVGAESILSRASRNIADKSAPERRAVRGAGSESAANAAQYAGLAGSGFGGFYRVLSEYAQTAQLRKIAQSSSFLFGEAFARNGENGSDGASGADGLNGAIGVDGTVGTNATPAKGTVLPVEATRGALSRTSEFVFAQNGENGANGSDGATGADGANGARGIDGTNGTNAAPATPAKGTVLPVEATRGTLSRAGEVVFAQNGENGANGSDGATGAYGSNGARGIDGTNGTNAAPAKGTVLPVEAAHGALSRAGEFVFAQNGENGANGSDGATGAYGANGARGIDGANGANGMNATPAKGTVLPVEAAHGALSRTSEVVFAQNGENGANGSDGVTGADGTNGLRRNDGTNGTNAAPATPVKGTVLPVEAAHGTLSRAGEVVFAQNGENGANGSDGVTGADGANGVRGIDGTNAAPDTPAKGTVLPVEATRGTLSRTSEFVFAQNGENGANGSDGVLGADGTNGARGIDGTNGTNAAPATPVKGTVLPVEATRGALSRAGEVVFAQNGENGANGSDGATGADGANGAPATPAKGTVLPVEATRGALSRAGEVVFAQNGENGANGSDGVTGADGSNGARGIDGTNGTNATPVKGTVLPVEATRGALSRAGEVVFAQNGKNGANGSDGATGADGANGAPATPAKGTVLPVEATRGALSRAGEVVFAQNGENGANGSDGVTGADGSNGARGIDGTNGTNATPVKGTVLPVEATRGALSRAGEVVFAQNGKNGANGSDGATGADGANVVRGNDGANVTNAAPATPAKGTVLPVEATRGALSRTGEVVFAQNGENGANGSDGVTGADGTNGLRGNDGANVTNAAPAKGTVLPVEATRGTLSRTSEVVFAQNGENGANGSDGVTGADGANGARGIDGTNGTNAAPATPAKGTVLPIEATRGALSRPSEVVFAQNGENGANGSDGATGADGANVARGNDGANVTNAAPATPAKGTVLPVEAARGALSRPSEVVFAQNGENGSDGTNGARGIDGTNGAASTNSSTARKAGRILPAGGTVRAAAGPHKPQSTADSGISRAVMDRLDPQTASALAGLVREAKGAGQGAVYTARIVPAQTEHGAQELSYAQTEGGISQAADSGGGISANAMRIMLMNLRTAALSRKNTELRTLNVSRHNQNVIRSANAPARKYDAPYLAMRSAVTFRTTESADIVMLAPPVEMDRFSAESGYSRQMPPIEFKQREEAPAPPPAAKPKAVSKTTEQIVRTQLPKGLDGLSYAEISRLADKVYAQIEARLNRERIRRGL